MAQEKERAMEVTRSTKHCSATHSGKYLLEKIDKSQKGFEIFVHIQTATVKTAMAKLNSVCVHIYIKQHKCVALYKTAAYKEGLSKIM